jgi:hypothetical protein
VPVYADRSEHRANQGDVFREVSFWIPGANAWRKMLGLVVQHDCDLDKFLKPRTPLSDAERDAFAVTVAPVHPIDDLSGGRPKAVRAGDMSRYFHLPAEDDHDELVADLWLEQAVRMVDLLECDRMASLSDEWRERLWAQIFKLRIRLDESKVFVKGGLRAG